MAKSSCLVCFGLLFACLVFNFVPSTQGYTHLTNQIDWKRPNALSTRFLSRNTKPIIYVVHKSWCGACEFMRKEFDNPEALKDLISLSKDFVMVAAEDDDEPTDPGYAPDGGYFPRVVVLSPSGKVQPQYLANKEPNTEYKYTFFYPSQIVDLMHEVMQDAAKGVFRPGFEEHGEEYISMNMRDKRQDS